MEKGGFMRRGFRVCCAETTELGKKALAEQAMPPPPPLSPPQIPVVAQSLAYVLFDLLLRHLFPGIAVHGLHAPPQSAVVLGTSFGGATVAGAMAAVRGTQALGGGGGSRSQRRQGGSRRSRTQHMAAELPKRLAGAAANAAEGVRTTVRSLSANMGAGLSLLLTGSHPAAASGGGVAAGPGIATFSREASSKPRETAEMRG
jgi:hypothetical protein